MDPRVAPPQLKQVFEDTTRPKRRPLADLLDLPSGVRNRLGDPDDAVEIVGALVGAAGLRVQVQDDVVLSQGQAIVVLRSRFGEPVTPPMLNHAYRRFIQVAHPEVSCSHQGSCSSWTCAAASPSTRRCFTRVRRGYSGSQTPCPSEATR